MLGNLFNDIIDDAAATMRYAQKMGWEIIMIDPATRLISHSNPVLEPALS